MEKQVNILERTECSTGVTLYEILSSDGVTKYYATVSATEVFCECKSFQHRGRCYHTTQILALQGDKTYAAATSQVEQARQVQYSAAPSTFDKPAGLAETYQACWYRQH